MNWHVRIEAVCQLVRLRALCHFDLAGAPRGGFTPLLKGNGGWEGSMTS